MNTWGEKDLCLFWEWAQENFGRSVFKKGQFRLYYGVSHRGAVKDESGDLGP